MVSLTRKAAEIIRGHKNGKKYIRISAKESIPESDFNIEFTDSVNHDDIMYLSYGIKIIVDSSTRKIFEDLKVDYTGVNGSGQFVFKNHESLLFDM